MPKFLQAGSVDLLYFKLIPVDLTDNFNKNNKKLEKNVLKITKN